MEIITYQTAKNFWYNFLIGVHTRHLTPSIISIIAYWDLMNCLSIIHQFLHINVLLWLMWVFFYRIFHAVLVSAPSHENFVARFAHASRTFTKLQPDHVLLSSTKENKAWNSYGCSHPIVTHLCEKQPSVKTANFISHNVFYKMISNKKSCVWCIWLNISLSRF